MVNIHRHLVSVVSGIKRISIGIAAATVMLAMVQPMWSQKPEHPLDGLTATEMWTVFDVLQSSGKVDLKTRFPVVQLKEAPKEEVLAWKSGQPMRREVFVVVKQGPRTIADEQDEIDDAVKENAEFQGALKRRGITNLSTIVCGGSSAGYFGTAEEQGRRLLLITCQDVRGSLEAAGRTIEGLTALWDLNEKKVLRVTDTGVVPVPQTDQYYDVASVGVLRHSRNLSSPSHAEIHRLGFQAGDRRGHMFFAALNTVNKYHPHSRRFCSTIQLLAGPPGYSAQTPLPATNDASSPETGFEDIVVGHLPEADF